LDTTLEEAVAEEEEEGDSETLESDAKAKAGSADKVELPAETIDVADPETD
jgi:hypothetical protein